MNLDSIARPNRSGSDWVWMSIYTLSLLGLASGLGCKPDWQADTYPVRGTIVVNGNPPTGAVVTLYSADEKIDVRNSKPWGVVSSDGTYQLQTYQMEDGAPVGKYIVTLRWPWDVADMSQALTDRLGDAYAFPDRSKWSVSVLSGENVLDRIEIVGAKVESKRSSKAGNIAARPPGPTSQR